MSKESTIIFGFPGVGKSYAFDHQEELGLVLQDSDSSKFHWVYDNDNNLVLDNDGKKILHPEWPDNYIKYIMLTGREQDNPPDYIFVSTHEEVMNSLLPLGFESIIIIPDGNDKDFYLNLYKERGNDDAFIKMMDEKWDDFIKGTLLRAMATDNKNTYFIMVGPNRPGKYKNLYTLLKEGIELIFPMEFDEDEEEDNG